MEHKLKVIPLAAFAGASCLLSGHSARADITISSTRTPDVMFSNGTYDVIVFDVTAMTGVDATPGNDAGNTQDPEILALSGTFSVTGGSRNPEMAMVARAGSMQGLNFLSSSGSSYGGPGTLHSSYVAFPSDTGPTITEVGSSSKTSGNASSMTDTWYVVPYTGNGNAGGVEPGEDPQNLTLADGGSDPYANDGMLAEILVNSGANVSFSGSYVDYGYPSGNAITFSSAAAVPEPAAGILAGAVCLLLSQRRRTKFAALNRFALPSHSLSFKAGSDMEV